MLLGNVLRWETDYLGRQHPVLPAAPGFARKVKPLVRLGERETAAYCVLRGIDYQVEECPMAAGNRHLGLQGVLNALEERSPGTKAAFLFGFLERGHERFAGRRRARSAPSCGACTVCGAPTPGDVCAFCQLRETAPASCSAEVDAWPRRSPPATACCSSTPSGAGTSSRSPRAASSTPTRACSRTTTLIGSPTRASTVRTTLGRAPRRGAARRSPSTCSRCRAARR